MDKLIHVPNHHDFHLSHDGISEFKKDIHHGLSSTHKQIPSKYFYDEHGCELFQQITRHPDYYPTQCEIDILTENKHAISEIIGAEAFNLVELGPGEGVKTELLIEQFQKDARHFTYIPIDISAKYLRHLNQHFKHKMPQLHVTSLHADYFLGLEWLHANSERRNLVLFLGSSIGNFDHLAIRNFLAHLWAALNANDYIVIGFDLRKDIDILMRAYNDDKGITRDFNLNLLTRMNHELGAAFDADTFRHYATYNVHTGAMESYLVSLKEQHIHIKALNQNFYFDPIESIHVECSFKYLFPEINELMTNAGFEMVENFIDQKKYFCDVLCRVKK